MVELREAGNVLLTVIIYSLSRMLQTLMGKVSLTVARLKSGLIPNQRPNCNIAMKKSESVASDCKSANRQLAKSKFHCLLVVSFTSQAC